MYQVLFPSHDREVHIDELAIFVLTELFFAQPTKVFVVFDSAHSCQTLAPGAQGDVNNVGAHFASPQFFASA